jgi:DNA-directed RNA polymerase subunit beta'
MRTFHTGGVAEDNITTGLPRVQELFEARKPKWLAIIAEHGGRVEIRDDKKKREILITPEGEDKQDKYVVPFGFRIKVETGNVVEAGDELTEGSVNPHDILKIKGIDAVQQYILKEVQRVYRLQGVEINDKHIEVIARQMLKKVCIESNGDSEMLPGQMVDRDFLEETNRWLATAIRVDVSGDTEYAPEAVVQEDEFNETNARVKEAGGAPAVGTPAEFATYRQVILGITKASLATNSFLSAASFQETTRVLTDAAIKGRVDPLIGLKENVIIGKLIPAGTGMKQYSSVRLSSDIQNVTFTDADVYTDEYAEVE